MTWKYNTPEFEVSISTPNLSYIIFFYNLKVRTLNHVVRLGTASLFKNLGVAKLSSCLALL